MGPSALVTLLNRRFLAAAYWVSRVGWTVPGIRGWLPHSACSGPRSVGAINAPVATGGEEHIRRDQGTRSWEAGDLECLAICLVVLMYKTI